MQGRNVIRMILFVVFFSIGAGSLGISILCVNADYDALLEQLEKDPNLIKRLAPAALGTEPEDANAVYPRATPEQLAAARKALTQDPNDQSTVPTLPEWLTRCSEPRRRITLFVAGSVLILISFTCFTPVKQTTKKE